MPTNEVTTEQDTQGIDESLQYWATKPADELAEEVMSRVGEYYQSIEANGILDLWRLVYCTYYGLDYDASAHSGSEVRFGGEIGEVVMARVGHLRSIVQFLLVTTTAHKLNFQPRSTNTDYKSKAQTYSAKSLLDYYEREKRLGREYKSVALRSLLYGMGYLWQNWDPAAGREYAVDVDVDGEPTGDMKHEGDIVAEAKSPIDVVHDLSRRPRNQQWYIVRETQNKFDLAAKYRDAEREDLERAIIGSEAMDQIDSPRLFSHGFGQPVNDSEIGTDDIDIFHFYHDRTDALPGGRYCVVASGDLWLYDGPLPYQDMPVHHMYPDEFLETAWGYTTAWDLISNDELYDALVSSIFTAVDAFMIPNIFVPEGGELGLEETAGGMNLIRYPRNMDPPQVARMLDIPKVSLDLLDFLQKNGETRSGVNATARGESDSSVKSGVHAALMNAQALHFNSGLEQAFVALNEDGGTSLIRIFKQFGDVPRMIQIVGETGKGPLREFTNDDVADIDRVIVDSGNPLERTIAGKEAMARALLEAGLFSDPGAYFEVLNTGRLESVYRPDQLVTDTIGRENELLGNGQVNIDEIPDSSAQGEQGPGMPPPEPKTRRVIREVPVLPTDPHAQHIQRHVDELGSPEARTDTKLLEISLVHVRDHVWNMQFGDPALMGILGNGMAPQGPPPDGQGGPNAPGGATDMPDLNVPPGVPMGGEMGLPKPAGPPPVPVTGQGTA